MRIRTKVLIGFTLLLGIVLAQGLIEYRHAVSARQDLDLFEFSSVRETVVATNLQEAVSSLELILTQGAGPELIESGNVTIAHLRLLMDQATEATAAGAGFARKIQNKPARQDEEAELLLLKALQTRLESLAHHWSSLADPAVSAGQRKALAAQALTELQQEVKPRVKRYRDNSIGELTEHSHIIRARSDRVSFWFLGAALAAIVVAAFSRFWLVRTVMKPLGNAVEAANEITGGNLDRRLNAQGTDEFAVLASAFNHMLDKLAATAASLAESHRKLDELNDRLEQRVATRTHKLRESEERFRRLVDGVKDYAIFMLDVDGLIVSWNRGAERIKGYAADEIIGGAFSKFYRPDDLARGKPAHALEAAKAGGRYEETGRRVRSDGREFLAHMVITAVRDEDGALKGFATITRDITQQQKNIDDLLQQKELMRLLLENLAEAVVACDATGKLTFLNKTARDWHGIDIMQVPEDQWRDSFVLYAADGVTPLPVAGMPLVRAESGERVRNAELVIARKDQAPRHVIASGDVLQDSSGKMVGAVMVMHDITERRNAERHNLRTQRLESIGTLSGGIAHDLNNALAPILMGIELLKARYPDSQSFLGSMETSAKRGAGMVRQLLTFAKGVDGQRVTLQPRHLINEIESIIERTFPKNIEHSVALGENLHPILGDATQIHQVLLNLCVNARDAMPDGGQLTIDARNHQIDALYASGVPDLKPGPHIRIQISDTGTGMPPEIIERIFEPFFSTKPADKGTGLGLSTVIGIVRSHSGCVQVYSRPGEGTRFSIYLPVAEEGSPISITPFTPEIDFAGDGRSILVVEDEPAVREIARAVLLSLDFKVLTANDGEDALLQLAANPDRLSLIITDLHMPKMDGLAFVKKARELAPALPIIVSSGRLEKTDADRLAELGVRALLHKPFTQGDLVESLQHVFSRGSTEPFRTQTV